MVLRTTSSSLETRIVIHKNYIQSKGKVLTHKMANLFSAVTLILMMTTVLACFVIAAPVRVGNQTEPQARKTLREGLIVLSNAAVSVLMI